MLAAHVLAAPPPREARTHRRGTVTGVRVVLDFPQSLVEAFSLVCFPIFVLILFIGEQVFGAQEGAGEKQSRGEPRAEAAGGAAQSLGWGGARQRLRLVSAEEEDGVLVRRGFHGAVRDVIDLKGNPKREGGERERLEHVLCEAPGSPGWRRRRDSGTHGGEARGGPPPASSSHAPRRLRCPLVGSAWSGAAAGGSRGCPRGPGRSLREEPPQKGAG